MSLVAFDLRRRGCGDGRRVLRAVPFYNWFCRTTGYGGTTQVAKRRRRAPLARTITVRFDSNVAGGLPWKFEPEQTEIDVKLGEVVTVYYT
jgi:cytochrome c oxidase assembly protein subunit 11